MPVVLADAKGNPKVPSVSTPKVLLCLFSYSGIMGRTVEALFAEMLLMNKHGIPFTLMNIADDALISRSRSKALSSMLQGGFDVCLMVDHDIEWSEPGALVALAVKAHTVKSCVSGIYSARAVGRGAASRPKADGQSYGAMEDTLVDADFLSGGFLAIPRVVAEEVLKAGETARVDFLGRDLTAHALDPAQLANQALYPCAYNVGPVVYDFFRPICVPRTFDKPGLPAEATHEYLSEDWAFSWRCKQANPNRPLYLWAMPWLLHWGNFPFTMKTAFTTQQNVPARAVTP